MATRNRNTAIAKLAQKYVCMPIKGTNEKSFVVYRKSDKAALLQFVVRNDRMADDFETELRFRLTEAIDDYISATDV